MVEHLALEYAKYRLAIRACQFVEDGLRDTLDHTLAANLDGLKGVAATAVAETAGHMFHYVNAQKSVPANAAAYKTAAKAAFRLFVQKWQDPLLFRSTKGSIAAPAPTLGLLSDDEEEAIVAERFGPINPDAPADDPVVLAWRTAKANMRRARQRIGTLYYLSGLLKQGQFTQLEREVGGVSTQLWRSYRNFQHTYLAFSAILQGAYLEEARKHIADAIVGPEQGVLQYLEVDERIGGYYGKDEKVFRGAIARYTATPAA